MRIWSRSGYIHEILISHVKKGFKTNRYIGLGTLLYTKTGRLLIIGRNALKKVYWNLNVASVNYVLKIDLKFSFPF